MKVINLTNYKIVVFNSNLAKEAFFKLKKHNPKALRLVDEEGNEYFGFEVGNIANLSESGITFDKVDNEGKLLISIKMETTNMEIAEEFSVMLANANKLEKQALEAYEKVEKDLLEIADSIETDETVEEVQ